MRTAIHEMRNHLAVAMAGIEAFLDRKLEPSDTRLEALFAALHAVDRIIDDLPSDRVVRFKTLAVSIDVCRLVATHVVAMEGFAAECGVLLTMHICDEVHSGLPAFVGDPARIAEIVTNILINAIRSTPAGGEVHVDCVRDATHVRVRISDEGPGLEQALRARLLEPRTTQTPSRATQSGIGLALTQQFVARHGGSIAVSDAPLGGAVFTVTLPGQTLAMQSEPRRRRTLPRSRAPRTLPLRATRERLQRDAVRAL